MHIRDLFPPLAVVSHRSFFYDFYIRHTAHTRDTIPPTKNGQVTETLSSDDESISSTGRDMTMGNDSIFFLSFVFAFLFNWIGFLMAYCLSSSAAGRLGALSGFGLSLVKWILIFKHSQCCTDIVDSQTWLWWILIVLGVMICLQGLFNYVRVRRQAIQGNNRHYLFFYY
uniref:Uncharacterized protein n=1 Tax=Branchiostoma floridae TaxID=7739 RepID=C3XWE4_BRAFL|eukprot:XP_002611668.1 hypothetical protein BRAFLDRAFT_63656 [Branchiostoma floridae]